MIINAQNRSMLHVLHEGEGDTRARSVVQLRQAQSLKPACFCATYQHVYLQETNFAARGIFFAAHVRPHSKDLLEGRQYHTPGDIICNTNQKPYHTPETPNHKLNGVGLHSFILDSRHILVGTPGTCRCWDIIAKHTPDHNFWTPF